MGQPQIVYNGKTINIDKDPTFYRVTYPREVRRNESVSGLVETLTVRSDVLYQIDIMNLSESADITLKRELRNWFQWAVAGSSFTFARDRTEAGYTLMSAAATAGSTAITVLATTSLSTGKEVIIKSDIDVQLVSVNSIDSTTVISIVEALDFDFASGSRVRSLGYFPGRVSPRMKSPIVDQHPVPLWDIHLELYEDLSTA